MSSQEGGLSERMDCTVCDDIEKRDELKISMRCVSQDISPCGNNRFAGQYIYGLT